MMTPVAAVRQREAEAKRVPPRASPAKGQGLPGGQVEGEEEGVDGAVEHRHTDSNSAAAAASHTGRTPGVALSTDALVGGDAVHIPAAHSPASGAGGVPCKKGGVGTLAFAGVRVRVGIRGGPGAKWKKRPCKPPRPCQQCTCCTDLRHRGLPWRRGGVGGLGSGTGEGHGAVLRGAHRAAGDAGVC